MTAAATPAYYGRMVSDEEAPVIVSYLPASGTVLRSSQTLHVSVQDNFKLASVTAEYSDSTGESWALIGTADTGSKTDVVSIEWPLSGLTPGTYQVRYTVRDSAGNTGIATVTYVVEDYTPPVSPVLSAVEAHRSVVLSWTYGGSGEQLARFEIYRAEGEEGQYTRVASTTDSTWTDKKVTVGTTYLYVDTMDATTATLDLPESLSLASIKASAQDACISLGSIAPGETATANWYIRGDKEGEYDLTACVKGMFMPNPEAFEVRLPHRSLSAFWPAAHCIFMWRLKNTQQRARTTASASGWKMYPTRSCIMWTECPRRQDPGKIRCDRSGI